MEDVSRDEYTIILNRALNILGLFISNVAGLEDCQTLAVCKVFFRPDKNDERYNSRDIIKFKWLINNNHHKACTENVIVERF